jgi:hypothetical protein
MQLQLSDSVVTADFWDGHPVAFDLLPKMIKLMVDKEMVNHETLFKFKGVSRGHFTLALRDLYKEIGFFPKAVAIEEEGKFVVAMSLSPDFQVGSTVP